MDGSSRVPFANVEVNSAVTPSLLTTEQAVMLLRVLGSDQTAYEKFQHSPADILAELGLPQAFVACCKDIVLPPAEVIRATQETLLTDLTCKGVQVVIGLNAR